jgi:uncharacterized protein
MLTLYGAEWCPFTSAVREILTELGVDFVTRQVEPWPEHRVRLREIAGTDQIPTLQTDEGRFFVGTRAIFAHLRELEPWEHAGGHRRRFLDHRDARESDAPGQLVEYFRASDDLEEVPASPEDAKVVDVPEASRYELRIDGRRIGVAAYHRRNGRIAFTHTEVDEPYEGRGFGSRLAGAVLDDARRHKLDVVPLCPFIAGYIEEHPEYEELVAPGYRDG